MTKGNQTQWTAQFLGAAEPVRRDYIVSFTMRNSTPMADLMVGRLNGRQFWVDVKGVTQRSAILQREKPEVQDLYYIVVNVAKGDRNKDEFYVLSQGNFNRLIRDYFNAHPNDRKV